MRVISKKLTLYILTLCMLLMMSQTTGYAADVYQGTGELVSTSSYTEYSILITFTNVDEYATSTVDKNIEASYFKIEFPKGASILTVEDINNIQDPYINRTDSIPNIKANWTVGFAEKLGATCQIEILADSLPRSIGACTSNNITLARTIAMDWNIQIKRALSDEPAKEIFNTKKNGVGKLSLSGGGATSSYTIPVNIQKGSLDTSTAKVNLVYGTSYSFTEGMENKVSYNASANMSGGGSAGVIRYTDSHPSGFKGVYKNVRLADSNETDKPIQGVSVEQGKVILLSNLPAGTYSFKINADIYLDDIYECTATSDLITVNIEHDNRESPVDNNNGTSSYYCNACGAVLGTVNNSYEIYFDADGGTIDNQEIYKTVYTFGNGLTLPIPQREGYVFTGWKDRENNMAYTEISPTDFGDRIFYATWIEIPTELSIEAVDIDKKTVSVKTNQSYSNVTLIVARYDKSTNRLEKTFINEMANIVLDEDYTDILTFAGEGWVVNNDDIIKVFIWENLTTLIPLCEALEK